MKSNITQKQFARSFVHAALAVALCLLATGATALAAGRNPNPGVRPVGASPYGKSYGEWSAEWWKWCYSLPVDHHPLFDTADCSAGQSGPVWFLGGTFTLITGEDGSVIGQATRTCSVPTGKALFFPILNTECSTAEGNGETEEALRGCATFYGSAVENPNSNLECTVDGAAVNDVLGFRMQSPLFVYGPLPENNILQSFGLDAPVGTTSPAVSDGVFLMLAPLSKGDHTIHFSGSSIFTQEVHGFDFVFRLDITYHLTVE
jgi:hypothetical protein